MRFYSLASNWSVASRIKPQKGVHHPTKCDVINDIKLFPAVYRRIYGFFFFFFNTLFSPSSDIQRVGEGHPSACPTNYSKCIFMDDCISSSPLSCTFHAISKAVLKQFTQPRRHHSVVWFYLSKFKFKAVYKTHMHVYSLHQKGTSL